MLKNIIILLFMVSSTVFAEEKVTPGEGWNVWKAFTQNCIDGKAKEADSLLTDNFRNKFVKPRKVEDMAKEFNKDIGTFVKELKVDKGILVHISMRGQKGTVFLKSVDKQLKLDSVAPGFFESVEDFKEQENKNRIKVHQAKLKSQLKQIGTAVASNYIDEGPRLIPHWKKLDIPAELMSYIHPETGKKEDVLIVEGVEYNAAPDLALAATKSPIGGVHIVVWEDGHVSTVTAEKFKTLAVEMVLIKAKVAKLSESEISEVNKLIEQLGAKKFKERKAAKEELLNKDARVISHLEKHLAHDDFEVQVSLKEIIKVLKAKSAPKRRVKK